MTLTKRTLGRTGLEVTDLSYGAKEVRGSRIWNGRPVTESQAETILNAVLDSGINFIDTANDYGRSEEFIGKYISNRRDQYYLATKCGCTVVRKDDTTDETPHVWTRENLFRGLNESLERMRTDYVDLIQLVILPMFLFSGTFYPLDAYPEALRAFVQLTPLYQGVDLLRALAVGHVDGSLLVHVAYLAAMGVIGLAIVARRLDKLLLK